jgi:hypothetical protein
MCIKLVIKTSLYYDARSEKHQISGNEVGSFIHTSKKLCEMLIGHELHSVSTF